MPRIYRIRDFDKHQHYRSRTPPWIKMYNALLEDYDFGLLPDAAKAHYLSLCLLASRYDNMIIADAAWVRKRINATTPVDLELLEQKGFLVSEEIASIPLASRKQNACPERETEEETEKETEEETGQIQMSGAPDLSVPEASHAKKAYPPAFEAFWRDYPTDPLMSKSCAFARWRQLMPLDQAAAHAAITSFKNYCARNPTYRPVHAERFLSQRRFDGFAVTRAPADPVLMRGLWDGAACQLVDAIGPDLFKAHFGDVVFEDGPPVTFYAATPFRRDIIMEKFASHIRRIFGEEASVEVKPRIPGQEKTA